MKISSLSRLQIFLIPIGIFLLGGVIYGAINYAECFPNGCSIYQSLSNGWSSPAQSSSKEIMTPEGCRKITTTSAVAGAYFIPTKTLAEWVSFRDNPPSGVSIGTCGIDGICGAANYSCTAGTKSNYVAGSCGGYSTWKCNGTSGGVTVSCKYYNAPSPNMGNSCTYPCYWKRAAKWMNRPVSMGGSGGGIWCNPTRTAPMPPADWGVDWPILQYYCDGPKPTSANGTNTTLIYYNNCQSPLVDDARCDVMCRTTVHGKVQCDGTCGGPWQ